MVNKERKKFAMNKYYVYKLMCYIFEGLYKVFMCCWIKYLQLSQRTPRPTPQKKNCTDNHITF
jgi:hypothetical protein